jgi:XTP/dITP diphosphohydrolase
LTRLLLATRNSGKLRELEQLLSGEPINLETLAAHPDVDDVEETGDTFEANAELKATHAARATGLWSLGEDSGISVDALGGAPGIYSARYAGTHGDDEANNRKLIEALRGEPNRAARYVCAMALASPDGEIVTTLRGISAGHIVDEPRGRRGFGYDPYFVSEGETRTNAELTDEEKSAQSHRGRAVRALVPMLRLHLELPGDR